MKFKVGDRVIINQEGFNQYARGYNNPEGVIGTIHCVSPVWYDVIWDNGVRNSYEEGTIDLHTFINI